MPGHRSVPAGPTLPISGSRASTPVSSLAYSRKDRHVRRIPTLLRFVGPGCGVLTLTLFLAAAVSAQENAAKPAPSTVPLSHYAPRDGLAIYVEFAGLETH